MADKMVEAFEAFEKANPEASPVQLFQAGYSASAVSMRERAVAIVTATKLADDVKNDLLTKIGELPDIAA